MKIVNVEPILLTTYTKWQWGTRPCTYGFVRVTTDNGLVGFGETYVAWYAPEVIPPYVEHFGNVVVGEDPFQINRLWRMMHVKALRWSPLGVAVTVIGAIEMALWDILGKSLEVPVYQLLGGLAHNQIRCYTSLAGPDMEAIKKLKDEGYTAVKVAHTGQMTQEGHLSIAALVNQESTKAANIRQALGNDVDMILDPAIQFNRAPWSADMSLKVVQALEPYNLLWMEQPALPTNVDDYARIRALTSTPIAAGEMGTTLHDYKPFFEKRAIDIVQPDASWCGGISECAKIHAAAAAHDMRVAPHSFSGAVGLAANYHVAFSSRNCFMLKYPTQENTLARGLIGHAFKFKDGHVQPTGVPGLGINLNQELINKFPFVPNSGIAHSRAPFPRPTPNWTPKYQDTVSW
ncbi:MAG: hypothetical protein CMJ20_03640 [Phycisphaeraceae bacterium]|nr:hypothetical protein [Phycisphaeraceae bacterium]|tara:strand:- start:2990 stop:4201 length:1212 start_codon:yes stop_codon:yes gene_type:complete